MATKSSDNESFVSLKDIPPWNNSIYPSTLSAAPAVIGT